MDDTIRRLLGYFSHAHLPPHLAAASAPFGALAERVAAAVTTEDPAAFRDLRTFAEVLAVVDHPEAREAATKMERVAREALASGGYGWRMSLGRWLRLLLEAKDCAVRAAVDAAREPVPAEPPPVDQGVADAPPEPEPVPLFDLAGDPPPC